MKTIKYLFSLLCLLVAGNALAESVGVAPITVKAGESSEIVISCSIGSAGYTAYQMSLYLPDGVSLQKDEDDDYIYELSSRHNKNHTFSVNEQTDGGLMLLCYSTSNKTIKEGDGELVRLPIDVAPTATGTLTAQLKAIKFSDTSSATIDLPDVSFNIAVEGEEQQPPVVQTNSLYAQGMTVFKGESERLSIQLDNSSPVIMYEFYMQLPEGLHVAEDADGYLDATLNDSRKDRTHSLEMVLGDDGLYHVLCYSNRNNPLLGNEGEVMSVSVVCDEGVSAGQYQGVLKGILIADGDQNAIELADQPFTVEVIDYILGDVNNDRKINGMDIVKMVSLIMDKGYAKAADLYPVGSPDGVVNGMDLVKEVDMVMNQSTTAMSPAKVGRPQTADVDVQDHLWVDDVTLEPGQTTEVAVELVNPNLQYIMTEFWMSLPDGVSLAKDEYGDYLYEEGDRFDRTHSLVIERDGESNNYHFLIYSSRNKEIKGTEGTLFTLTLQAAEDAVAGTYECRLYNLVFSDTEQNEVNPADTEFSLTIAGEPDPVMYSVSVTVENEAQGSVSIAPESEDGSYAEGTELTLTAKPAEGYHFAGWSNGEEENPYNVTVTADLGLTAQFAPNQYALIYIVGTEEWARDSLDYGAPIELRNYETVKGYWFDGWLFVDGVNYDTMPAHDVTVVASIMTGIRNSMTSDGLVSVRDLSGRCLRSAVPADGCLNGLPAGIYIVDGHKVVKSSVTRF